MTAARDLMAAKSTELRMQAAHRSDDESESALESPTFASLRSLQDSPSIMHAPIQVAHRLAYEARAIVLCAPDKAGKSSLLAAATAQVSRGRPFLGQPTCPGAVLWAGLEEHTNDAVQRFVELDADPDRVDLVVTKPENLLERIALRIARRSYVLIALDSVAEYARLVSRGEPPSEGDTSGWSAIARPLVDLCHRSGVALTALHHVRRDGEERGSTELFASFDAVWVMKRGTAEDLPSVRRLKGRSRRGIDDSPYAIRWDSGSYSLLGGAGELSVDARVLLHVEQNSGISTNKLRGLVGGRAAVVDAAVAELVRRGAIRRVDAGWVSTSAAPEDETA
jgi:hypothetical protein